MPHKNKYPILILWRNAGNDEYSKKLQVYPV